MAEQKQNLGKEGEKRSTYYLKKIALIFVQIFVVVYFLFTLFIVYKLGGACFAKGSTSGILIIFCMAFILTRMFGCVLSVCFYFALRALFEALKSANKKHVTFYLIILTALAWGIFNS